MKLDNYEAIKTLHSTPSKYYKNHLQALVNTNWTNTTSLYTVKEEKNFDSFIFKNKEVHINHVIGAVTTGYKNGDDFRQLIFKDLEYKTTKGLYYQFDDNYWITTFTDNNTNIVRRCNNYLKWKSPIDGHVISYPCILDYEASSPNPKINGDIITPNNHTLIIVQGNEYTKNIKANQRFIFNNRPFKIAGYNNYMQENSISGNVNLLYFDAYLDEKMPNDDFNNSVANSDMYNYEIKLNQTNINQIKGYSTQVEATVVLNGEIVNKDIIWSSDNANIATVSETGLITLIGDSGTTKIRAKLHKDSQNESLVSVVIVAEPQIIEDIYITPIFNSVKQGQTLNFSANLVIDGVEQADIVNVTPSGLIINYSLNRVNNNDFSLTCLKSSKDDLLLTFNCKDITKVINVALEPLF